ncbi:MAG TPA: hypothetical protein VJ972_06775 [Anaerolineales bacterium]|nr:hypothetical protein [Anaerolineales bacterium]
MAEYKNLTPERKKQLDEMERAQLLATLGETPESLPAMKERLKKMIEENPLPPPKYNHKKKVSKPSKHGSEN